MRLRSSRNKVSDLIEHVVATGCCGKPEPIAGVRSEDAQVVFRAGPMALVDDQHHLVSASLCFKALAGRVDHVDDDPMRYQRPSLARHPQADFLCLQAKPVGECLLPLLRDGARWHHDGKLEIGLLRLCVGHAGHRQDCLSGTRKDLGNAVTRAKLRRDRVPPGSQRLLLPWLEAVREGTKHRCDRPCPLSARPEEDVPRVESARKPPLAY